METLKLAIQKLASSLGEPDPLGYSRSLLGFWRRQWDGFSVISYDRNILDRVAPNLLVEETDDPAQIRIEAGDLAHSQLAAWVNWMNYDRAMQTSLGNTRLLHAVSEHERAASVARA